MLRSAGTADGMVKSGIFRANSARPCKVSASLRAELLRDQLTAYETLYDRHGAGHTDLTYVCAQQRGDTRFRGPGMDCHAEIA